MHTTSWQAINDIYGARFPNVLKVIDLLLSLPSGSSECERGFSAMKMIKTPYRNKLRSSTLTLLMTVQLHTADIPEYDPEPAIHQWLKFHHRRPDFMEKKKRPLVDVIHEAEEADGGSGEPEHSRFDTTTHSSDSCSDFSDLGYTSNSEEEVSDKEQEEVQEDMDLF